jgi:hypothetical protein
LGRLLIGTMKASPAMVGLRNNWGVDDEVCLWSWFSSVQAATHGGSAAPSGNAQRQCGEAVPNEPGPVLVGVHVDYRDNALMFEDVHEGSIH